jgi:hypothetical protein
MSAVMVFTGAVLAGGQLSNAGASGFGDLLGGLLSPCPSQPLTQPFQPWLDGARYTLVPNGGFESGTSGWNVTADALLTGENESFNVRAAADAASLALSSGASAVSSSVCIGTLSTKLRFFARNTGAAASILKVDVLYTDALGLHWDVPIGVLVAGPEWRPTPPLPLVANITALPLLSNGSTEVAFRFTVEGSGGAWQVDDIYVDPYKGT